MKTVKCVGGEEREWKRRRERERDQRDLTRDDAPKAGSNASYNYRDGVQLRRGTSFHGCNNIRHSNHNNKGASQVGM